MSTYYLQDIVLAHTNAKVTLQSEGALASFLNG